MIIARLQYWAAAILLAATLVVPSASLAWDDASDEQVLAGLRSRGEFDAAEKYCVDRLGDANLSDDQRANLTIEWSRTCAEHALVASSQEQGALWRKARAVVEDFAARNPRYPRLVLVQMQAALAALAEGQLARENAEVAAEPEPAQEAARNLLRGAIAALKTLDRSIAAELQRRGTSGKADEPGQLPTAQLSSLGLHVRDQLARGLRELGMCYPANSADRINAEGQAVDLLSTLARHELTPELSWSVRLDEIACLRLVGNYGAAEKKLAQVQQADPPPAIVAKLRAERIRMALARGRIDEAVADAGPAGARADQAPDLGYAQLEAYLAAWRKARDRRDAAGAKRFEQLALDQVRALDEAHGTAASRRAEALVARRIVESGGSANPVAMLLVARSHYRAGQWDDALAAYEAAAQLASVVGDDTARFDIEVAAGALQQERKDHRAALERLRKLALELPKQARAAEAHLLAVHSAAQLAQEQRPPRLELYEELLREHVARWPDSPTASQAWWWLGRLEEHQQAWQEAIHALKHVGTDHPQYAQAVESIGRSYEAALGERRRAGNANDLAARDAVEYFDGIITAGGSGSPALKDAMRAAVLAAARISLKETPAGAAKAEHLLSAALRDDVDAPQAWKQSAVALLVPALAASGQAEKARELLERTPIGVGDDALVMIDMFAAAKVHATPEGKRDLAGLELAAIDDLLAKQDELDAAAIKRLVGRQVDTLVEMGRRDEAVAALAALAKKNPRDGQTQEDLAELLATGGDDESRKRALAQWHEIVTRSRPGSERWFRAQLATARLQLDSGNPAKARATVKSVEANYPELGGAAMKARFSQLLAECNRADAPPRVPKK